MTWLKTAPSPLPSSSLFSLFNHHLGINPTPLSSRPFENKDGATERSPSPVPIVFTRPQQEAILPYHHGFNFRIRSVYSSPVHLRVLSTVSVQLRLPANLVTAWTGRVPSRSSLLRNSSSPSGATLRLLRPRQTIGSMDTDSVRAPRVEERETGLWTEDWTWL